MEKNIQLALDQLRNEFIARLPERIAALQASLQEVARGAPGSLENFHRAAHSLVGTAGAYRLMGISDAARSLERISASLPVNVQVGDVGLRALQAALENLVGQAANPAESSIPAPALVKRTETIHIMVVEDDREQAAWLRSVLEQEGYQVEVFSELDAFSMALQKREMPAAVIMDMVFPEGGEAGAQIIADLKQQSLEVVPVIFLSVRQDIAARLAAHRAGATRYLTKPVDREILLRVIADSSALTPAKPYRVLVVDDDISQLAFNSQVLRHVGMEVRTVDNPLLVLDMLDDFSAEVLLLDMHMPQCSGPELAAILGDDERYAGIPIVYLSAETDISRQLLALDRGGDHFLVKPVNHMHLVSVIGMHARRFRLSGEQTEALRANRYAQERLRQALDTHAIVSSTDSAGNILHVNDKFCEISGYAREELLGKNHRIIRSAEHPPEFYTDLWYTISAGKVWQGEICNLAKDGSLYWVESSIVPFLDENGLPYQYISIRTDVTRLKAALAAAKQASRAKGDFLANMSHEIRTPMNGIIGMTKLALETELNAEQREYLGLVRSSADALLGVINDILDFSKIEAGMLDFDEIEFSLPEVLSQATRSIALRAHEKGLELLIDIAPNIPEILIGDPGRLRQVIVNLVGNAIKFTERGEVVVKAEMSPMQPGTDKVALHISVKDTGIGIPKEKIQNIFESFSQADASTTRKYGGTGLGLSISARLTELMHGSIWVESEPGRGSTFFIEIVLGRVSTVAPTCYDTGKVENLRVLVVDDNATNRLLTVELLQRWKMLPQAVADARQAIAELGCTEGYQLVLLDARMPDMDGFAAIEYLRAHPEISTTPIMMLTTEAQSSDAARCRELGHSAYLLKPYSQSDLFDAIVTALGLPGIHKTSRDTSNGSRKNQRELNVLLAEDNHVNQTLATRLLQKFGHRVEVARNGRIAVDKWQTGYYDLILMDVDMPELNGFDATAKIRELEQQSSGHIPIIGLTAHAMRGSREKCLAAGMDGYLSKPIDTNALWRELESVGTALPPPAPATPEDKPGSAAISCDFDLNNALSLMDNDMELFREMARIFLADYTDYLEKLGIAIMQKDPKNSRHFAHALKGMISIFGVPEISRIAGAIEMQESDNLDHDYAELKGKLDRLSQALQKAAS